LTDIRQKLAAIFQGEHAEHLEHIRSILALLENVGETQGRSELDDAFRRAHSLKGAARAVDLDPVEALASGLETLFSRVREGTLTLDRALTRVIHGALDASEECVEAFRDNRVPKEPAEALRAMEDLLGTRQPEGEAAAEKTASAATVPTVAGPPVEMVRLPAENLDRLVRSTA
jgi:two-component system chemotaxis sensor kinase CheA